MPTRDGLRRPDDWICGFGGGPLPFLPDALASQVVRQWYPTAPARVAASMPGWSGMASYTVHVGAEKLHMKVMVPKQIDGARAAVADAEPRGAIMREAHRAAWAGRLGVAPRVLHMDPAAGAYACQFVEGHIPSVEASKGKYLLPYLKTLSALHHAPTDALPPLSCGRSWLFDIDSATHLAAAESPRSATYQAKLLKLEQALATYIDGAPFRPTPVHGDLKLDNTLVTPMGVKLIDWGNLGLADPMGDLACFLIMADVPTRRFATMLQLYDAQRPATAEAHETEDNRLARLQANATLLRLKNVTFYDQWDGTRAKAQYLYRVLQNDLPLLPAEVGRALDA